MNKSFNKLSLRAGWISILTNTILFFIKYWAGLVSGSVSIIADAWHTLSDSLSSVFVIVGVKLSSRPADKEHPFGHGRYELIATILIGCLLAMVSYNFFMESIEKLKSRDSADFGMVAMVVTVVSILAKEALAQYSFLIGRKTGSRTVTADGWHHRSDALSSVIILVGIFLNKYFWWIDGVLGIIVALMILYTAIKIIKNSSDVILGEKPSTDLKNTIVEVCQRTVGYNIFPHHIHIHNYINHKELTLHIYLPDDMSIDSSHNITSAIEKKIAEELNIDTTIHVEPISHKPFDNDRNEL
jgi:cation diffusion facilitator family transporter